MDSRMTNRRREQTRARYPDEEAYAERDGVRLFYEVYGVGEPRFYSCRPGKSSTPGPGSSRSPIWPGIAGWSLSIRAETPLRPPRRL
jgi:hypothetical protein